jgi:hypothetical protein
VLALRRSNPSTPTQPRRPDFIGVSANHQPGQYYDFQAHPNSGPRPPMSQGYGSPQRRFMSEGELVRQEAQLSYPRSNNTVDNIRELANSPQRGVYMWKDTSPGYPPPAQHPDFYRSNPTSPTQQAYVAPRPYHPAVRGGVAVYPPQSPQVNGVVGVAGGTSDSLKFQTTRPNLDQSRAPYRATCIAIGWYFLAMTTGMSNDLNLFIVMKIQREDFESRSSPFRGEEGRLKDNIGRFRGMKGFA